MPLFRHKAMLFKAIQFNTWSDCTDAVQVFRYNGGTNYEINGKPLAIGDYIIYDDNNNVTEVVSVATFNAHYEAAPVDIKCGHTADLLRDSMKSDRVVYREPDDIVTRIAKCMAFEFHHFGNEFAAAEAICRDMRRGRIPIPVYTGAEA